jgi:hypothetical protein
MVKGISATSDEQLDVEARRIFEALEAAGVSSTASAEHNRANTHAVLNDYYVTLLEEREEFNALTPMQQKTSGRQCRGGGRKFILIAESDAQIWVLI